jgi:hypothetical protein
MVRIGDVPMKCRSCGHECRLDDCNADDPIGDGLFGCPIDDCGGEMEQIGGRSMNSTPRPAPTKEEM